MNGRHERVSTCCGARLVWRGTYGDFYQSCHECGKSFHPAHLHDMKYVPSDYEAALEARIAELEKWRASLG